MEANILTAATAKWGEGRHSLSNKNVEGREMRLRWDAFGLHLLGKPRKKKRSNSASNSNSNREGRRGEVP